MFRRTHMIRKDIAHRYHTSAVEHLDKLEQKIFEKRIKWFIITHDHPSKVGNMKYSIICKIESFIAHRKLEHKLDLISLRYSR